ncbi:hypothetical protein GIB67_039048 [Kingdonia uniflora]|uniref:SAM domain-containing protein n=1 Tax=Kingdonia uniflora TaxID=39325 RepID=A0A7J7LKS2_9MAGN|nr:hypothetical protein GIB67_039048 [Kingdonia uniflora]
MFAIFKHMEKKAVGALEQSQRGDDDKRSRSDDDSDDDKGARVGRNDLRVKLMLKKMSRHQGAGGSGQHKIDLREKLSKDVQSPIHTNVRPQVSESKPTSVVRLIPPARSTDRIMQMNSLSSSPHWSLDELRYRSPDRILSTSRALSPPRSMNEPRRIPSIRPVEVSRPTTYTTKEVVEASRHASLMTKSMIPHEAVKPIMRHPPSGNGVIQKSSYTGEVPLTVASLLHSLGLGKYEITFRAEEVDMTALRQMGDNDLKELGIPMVFSLKILNI